MPKKNIETELYNIKEYTDAELYEILDLLNPSDRELEAKILFFIRKYEDIGTSSSKKLVEFFESVYARFFDIEENEDGAEGYENLNTQYAKEANESYINNYFKQGGTSGNTEVSGNNIATSSYIDPDLVTTGSFKVKSQGRVIESGNSSVSSSGSNLVFTTQLDYAKDPLNPLLKQTTTRLVSIDSQYRDDKAALTTDFAFDLSEPLKDVVSMKLYSFQIPYTWYTIGKSFGCNFFYLKGNSPGINNGNHDIEISINAGNYSPAELASAVKTSIQNNYTIYTDVSFANTNITYNTNTSLSTVTIDLKKQFSENGYYINFPYFTSPYQYDASRNDSIPTFFGVQTGNYFTNSVRSVINLPLLTDPLLNTITTNMQDNTAQFIIQDNSNNFFKVIKYIGPAEYDPATSIIDTSFNVYFTSKAPGKYSRNALIADISNAIHNCPYVDNTFHVGSSIKRRNIDLSNGMVNNPNGSYFELKIKPNRKTTNNILNSKIAIEFPYEDPNSLYNVWTGTTSCFRFNKLLNESNTIYAEYPLLTEPQNFLIDDQVKIYLTCVHPGFAIPQNDMVISIPALLNPIDNYTYLPYPSLDAYISAINQGIVNADAIYGGSFTTAALNTNTGGSKAYIDSDGYFNIYLDIEKTFDQTTYVMDLTNSIFNTNNIKITDSIGNSLLTDLTKTYTTFVNTGGIFVTAGTIIAVIYPKPGVNAGNQGDVTYTLSFPTDKTYTDYTFFETDVNTIINNFVDPISGRTIFAGTRLSHNIEPTGYQITLTININKKLVSKNYSVNFTDLNKKNDSWRSYLFIDTSMYNNFYNLEAAFASSFLPVNNSTGQQILVIDNTQEVTVNGITPIIYKYLNIQKGVNDIINIIAYEDGIETTTGDNNLVIDILQGTTGNTLSITLNNMINIINSQLSSSAYFKGSELTTYFIGNDRYLKIRMNINRTYTASDYNLVFYDEFSFARCVVGSSSVQNTTWDSTLGWILGFRNFTVYSLSDYGQNGDVLTIVGDTGVCTNLYNYFLLCLDDYNQNHLNDGLVTITGRDSSVSLPSYANKDNFTCDPATGQLTYNTAVTTDYSKLTQNQIYALTTIANNKYNTSATGQSVSSKSYGQGPYALNVFAILPMKVAGLANGVSYMEYGGTLQNQGRQYFGPVNIRKMAVSLVSDRGNKVDLNNANWSFSIICEQLNKLKPST
jgi:hypothetical protein